MVLTGQPVLILKEGTERRKGRDAQTSNIAACVAVAEAVKTTLGPRGSDKLLIDSLGDITITNDGATILDEIDIQHPAAKMLVQVAKTQDQEVGDGTTSSVVIAGELLKRAEKLLKQNIHPNIIIKGYKMAAQKAAEYLNDISKPVGFDDEQLLQQIAATSLNSKSVGTAKELIAKMAVTAVKNVFDPETGIVDIDLITIIQKQGKSLDESEIINGVVIDKEVVNAKMPKEIKNAKIALINKALEIKKTEFDAKIQISDATMMTAFIDQEHEMLREMVDKIAQTGANVVFCQKGIDDLAQHFLAKKGILAVRRVKKSDMEKLSKATGARIVTDLDDLSSEDLGVASVKEVKIGDDKLIYVDECQDPKAMSIVLRGATKYVTDEAERSLNDALNVIADILEDGRALPGGGATEMNLAKNLRDYAASFQGREQLAIQTFAEALEAIPKVLAENAGLDSIDILVKLRNAHQEGKTSVGLEVFSGEISDMFERGVIEPYKVKIQALRSASEAAELILRIDDVIAAKGGSEGAGAPGGGMPPGMGGMCGMGGMPGMY